MKSRSPWCVSAFCRVIVMALNLVCAVLDRGPKDIHEMAVLLAIADSADKDSGEAWPSQATIGRRARQTDRSVRNVIQRLVVAGWLKVEHQFRANGSKRSSLYTINLAMLGEEPRQKAESSRGDRNPVPDVTGTRCRGVSERRSGHAPEPGSGLDTSHHLEPARAGGTVSREVDQRRRRQAVDVAALSLFERSRLRSGDSVMVDGMMIAAGSPLHAQWQEAVRAHDAQNVVSDDTSRPSPDRVAR